MSCCSVPGASLNAPFDHVVAALRQAVAQRTVSMSRVNDAALHVLELKNHLGRRRRANPRNAASASSTPLPLRHWQTAVARSRYWRGWVRAGLKWVRISRRAPPSRAVAAASAKLICCTFHLRGLSASSPYMPSAISRSAPPSAATNRVSAGAGRVSVANTIRMPRRSAPNTSAGAIVRSSTVTVSPCCRCRQRQRHSKRAGAIGVKARGPGHTQRIRQAGDLVLNLDATDRQLLRLR